MGRGHRLRQKIDPRNFPRTVSVARKLNFAAPMKTLKFIILAKVPAACRPLREKYAIISVVRAALFTLKHLLKKP